MRNTFRIVEEKRVIGKSFAVLIKDSAGRYVLSHIEVYKNAMIACPGLWTVHSLEDLERAIERGDIVDTLPEEPLLAEGTPVYQPGLGRFLVTTMESEVGKGDYLGMVQDILRELNGEATSTDACKEAFLQFLQDPTQDHYELLKLAYQKVPDPLRYTILGDPENGDTVITAILARDFVAIDKEWLEEQKQEYSDLFVFKITEHENV